MHLKICKGYFQMVIHAPITLYRYPQFSLPLPIVVTVKISIEVKPVIVQIMQVKSGIGLYGNIRPLEYFR